jgi:hypothetical protein
MNRSISKIFYGLLLIFFNINIYNINYFTSLIGILLIFTAIWQLRQQSRSFKIAFFVSVFQVIIQTFNLILLCSPYALNSTVNLIISVIGSINMLVLFYHLFYGFEEIAQTVDAEKSTCNPLRCFFLYLIALISAFICSVIAPLLYIFIPIDIIIFIYILYQVRKLDNLLNSYEDFQEKRLDKRYLAILLSYVSLSLIVCFVSLFLFNTDFVHTEIYHKSISNSKEDVEKVKSKMIAVGFDKSILSDLPDDEILKYQNIRAFHETVNIQQSDGGEVRLIPCTSIIDENNVRFLVYYHWIKPPKNDYSDVIGINYQNNEISIAHDEDFNCANIYDKKGNRDIVTYKADIVEKRIDAGDVFYPKVKFKLFGGDAVNQRGFFAVDAVITKKDEFSYNTFVAYCHQYNLFNIKYQNAFDFYLFGTQNNTMSFQDTSTAPNGFVFSMYSFSTFETYKS